MRGPLPDTHPSSHDAFSEPWRLGHLFRRDVEQADVAALIAALVGIDWPVNSVGVIPDVDPTRPGYLKLKDGSKGKAKFGLINAKVILEQYRIKDGLSKKKKFSQKILPFNTTFCSFFFGNRIQTKTYPILHSFPIVDNIHHSASWLRCSVFPTISLHRKTDLGKTMVCRTTSFLNSYSTSFARTALFTDL